MPPPSIIPPLASLSAAIMTMFVAAYVMLSEKRVRAGTGEVSDDEMKEAIRHRAALKAFRLKQLKANPSIRDGTQPLRQALALLLSSGLAEYEKANAKADEKAKADDNALEAAIERACTAALDAALDEEVFATRLVEVATLASSQKGAALIHAWIAVATRVSNACRNNAARTRFCAQAIVDALVDAKASHASEQRALRALDKYAPELVLRHTPVLGGTIFCLAVGAGHKSTTY